ncbi:MAG: rod shape-determining protein RodA [Deltaproteobacteria bacterium]|nr:rod shape-determining protein RodA [Deltaproteobacteria bacterium]
MDRRLLKNFDWGLFCLTVILGICGIGLIYSAVNAGGTGPLSGLYLKQMFWLCIGLFLILVICSMDYRKIEKWSPFVFVFFVILLIYVHFFGMQVGGSVRWLSLGPLRLQPSEPIKIAVILVLASYYARRVKPGGINLLKLGPPVIMVAIPFCLVALQPDLGTAGTIGLIAATMTIVAKIEKKTFVSFAALIAIILPFGWFLMEPYQRTRVLMLFHPESDRLGAGYHIIQSKIAVGSGMLYGKGYLHGTQNILSFLPEQHTDFIFSVLGEEWGFIGTIVVLTLFLLLVAFGINIAANCRDAFGTLVAVGVTSMIFWQTFINIAMVLGIMPVVGMPLPLISYGGSSVITIMIGIGLLMNISMRRFVNE